MYNFWPSNIINTSFPGPVQGIPVVVGPLTGMVYSISKLYFPIRLYDRQSPRKVQFWYMGQNFNVSISDFLYYLILF